MLKAFVFIWMIGVLFTAQAQEPSEPIKEIFTDAEFFMAREEYTDAVAEYLKLHRRGYNNAYFNYRIGICYLNIPGSKKMAIEYLNNATSNVVERVAQGSISETRAPHDVYIYLGNAYRITNQLDKAISIYELYKQKFNKKENIVNLEYVDQQITACLNAQKLMASPVNIEETNVGQPVNNASDNFRPAISGNFKRLAYMNSLAFYDAVYVSENINGRWSRPENITPQIQSDGDQFVSALSFDGNTMLLSRDDRFDSEILISTFKDGAWTKSEALPKPINSKYWESHGSLAADGKTLYFTSNRPGGYGEMDIYTSEVDAAGKWSEPKNMGMTVNSPLNEDCPFLSPDGNRLYFSSQGHFNIGGYDIFYTNRLPDGNWSAPVNIGFPVSTTDDDLSYCPLDSTQGLFARYTTTGYGRQDIYGVKLLPYVETADTISTPAPEPVQTAAAIPQAEPNADGSAPTEAVRRNIQLSPVYFQFNSFELTELSYEKLDKLADVMKEFPELSLSLTGFTDAKGSAQYNQTLSEKRAASVKKYLTNKGIEATRISTKGLGANAYVAINTNADGSDNADGRFYNRRVEMRFANAAGNLTITETIDIPENLKVNP